MALHAKDRIQSATDHADRAAVKVNQKIYSTTPAIPIDPLASSHAYSRMVVFVRGSIIEMSSTQGKYSLPIYAYDAFIFANITNKINHKRIFNVGHDGN